MVTVGSVALACQTQMVHWLELVPKGAVLRREVVRGSLLR